MTETLNKYFTNLLILILLLYFFLFYFNSAGNDESGGGRIDQLFLIVLVFFYTLQTFKNLSFFKDFVSLKKLSITILMFLGLWSISSLLFLNYNSIDRVISYLPTIFFVLSSFSFFLYSSFKGRITTFNQKVLAISVFLLSVYDFYNVFSRKTEALGDLYYKHSNNAGYGFVIILPLIMYVFRNNTIIKNFLLVASYIFILFSSKRGAILIGTVVLTYYFLNSIRNERILYKQVFYSLFIVISCAVILYFLQDNADNILYRFQQSGGSGRDLMYEAIYESILSGNFAELIFGHGFFSTSDVIQRAIGEGQMAHSDFFEVTHDLGIIGLIGYSAIFASFFKIYLNIRKISRENASVFFICLVIWMLKMSMSGVIVSKVSVFIFITMGIMVGETYRNVDFKLIKRNK